MNVVIYDPTQTEGPRLFQALKDRGVPAVLANDAMRLVNLIKQQRTELVLLCSQKFSPEIIGVAENLRENHVLEPAQIQLVSGPLDEADGIQVFESSIDSIIPWASDVEYVAARVAAVGR